MAANIIQVCTEYDQWLRTMPYVPRFSYGRSMLGDDGAPNKSFFFYIFCDQAMAIQFLKEIGLLRSRVPYNTDHLYVRVLG